jgi:hypothetical protein
LARLAQVKALQMHRARKCSPCASLLTFVLSQCCRQEYADWALAGQAWGSRQSAACKSREGGRGAWTVCTGKLLGIANTGLLTADGHNDHMLLNAALQLLYRRKVERMRGCTLSLCVRNFSTPKYEVSITDVPGEANLQYPQITIGSISRMPLVLAVCSLAWLQGVGRE